jgi:hypothetical protein
MKFSDWVAENQYRWVGFRQLQDQIAQAVGADFDVEASVVDIRFDRQGASRERRYLFLTAGAVLEIGVLMHNSPDFIHQELTATMRWLPLHWVASMGHAITLHANQNRPDARYTVKFQQESGLGPLLLPPMEQEDLQADELAEYLAFGQALSRRLLANQSLRR